MVFNNSMSNTQNTTSHTCPICNESVENGNDDHSHPAKMWRNRDMARLASK